jgi:hypothetical protein
LLRKKDKRFEKDVEKLPHKGVLPVEGPIKPLDNQLAEQKLHFVMVCILSQLSGKKHLADTFNCNLPKNSILDYHVILDNDSL